MKNQITEIALNVIMDLDSRENGLDFTNFVYDQDWSYLTLEDLVCYCEKYFHRIIKAEMLDNEIVKDILISVLQDIDWWAIADSLFDRVKPVE